MDQTLRKLAVFLVMFTTVGIGTAIAQGGPGLGGPPPCWPPPCIPIDGGLGLLVAAGTLLGGHKALEQRRARKRKV